MKRLPEPVIRNIKNPTKSDYQVIREEHPPYWILSELLYHTIFLYTDVHGEVSIRSIMDFASAIPRGIEISERTDREYAVFNDLYDDCSDKNQSLHNIFMDTVPNEEQAVWKELPIAERTQAYIKLRNEGVPNYQKLIDAGNFFLGDYRHIPADLRAVIDLAVTGFVHSTVHSPDFAVLCKDKSLDVSAMTFEEKMDAVLDHEAFYNHLLARLGHGGNDADPASGSKAGAVEESAAASLS